MTMDCNQISAITGFECSPVRGGLCIQTPYTLHDGHGVNVFVFEENDLCLVTDDGLTLFDLRTSGLLIQEAVLQHRRAIARICTQAAVHLGEHGDIHLYAKPNHITNAFHLVTEAIKRVAEWQREQLERTDDLLLEDVRTLLLAWRPDDPVVTGPELVGSTGRAYKFHFRQAGEFIDAITPSAQAGAAMAHKLLDVRNLVLNTATPIRIVLNDASGSLERARREGQILGGLATITSLSVLRQLGGRVGLH
jgi:Domain of unknown function DUF1828